MDEELKALLEATTDDGFDWSRLLRALQHRGYPGGKDGLKAVRARLKNFQTKMESDTKQILADESQRLFAEHPKLESFSWHQYTPYWIDGDPCSFSSHVEYPDINGLEYYTNFEDPDLKLASKAVIAMLSNFNDSYLMFRLFGDHKTVRINREGIFVETYEHEQ